MQSSTRQPLLVILFVLSLGLTGCSSIMSSATGQLAKNLALSIQQHDDPDTVASAMPAYLLMTDSFIQDDPQNIQMLLSGAKLYTAYANLFVNNEQRTKKLTQRAFDYALRAACAQNSVTCAAKSMPFTEFKSIIKNLDKDNIGILFILGQSWASWLKSHSDDWNAVAELPRIRLIFEKILILNENYQQGSAHLYMGILHSLLPASIGGKPDVAKQHFEMAIKLSGNKNLMAKVNYAEHHARLVFDQTLHDQLLNEVINAKVKEPSMTLINTIAQHKAKTLLKSGRDYF